MGGRRGLRLKYLLVACSLLALAGQGLAQGCAKWNTGLFFWAATIADVTACLSTGADVDARGEYGMTPLHFAAALSDNPAITEALIAAGAELQALAEEGYTPLHLAAAFNPNPAVIEVLLDRGADPTARDLIDPNGYIPWDYAEEGSDAYRLLEPPQGTVFGGASEVLTFLWDILLGAYGMALEMLAMFGEGGEWVLSFAANPTPFLETYASLSRYASNLNWSNLDPTRYLRAGMREFRRSMAAAKGVWETIPAGIRAQGEEFTRAHLRNMDWSHFKPYLPGWGDGPEDGIFEDSSLNRARGRAPMTDEEISAARRVLRRINFNSIIEESAKMGARIGLASLGVAGVAAALDYGLQYQEGKITAEVMLSNIAGEVAAAGAGGAAMSAAVVAMALLFPPLIPVMSTISIPLIVFGFAVMGERLVRAGKGWYEVYRRETPLDLDWIVNYYEALKAKVLGWIPSLTS